MKALSQLLHLHAATNPDRVAVVSADGSLTYQELFERATARAQQLRDTTALSPFLHVTSHPPLAITTELTLSFIETWWGAVLAGVPLLLQHPHDPVERQQLQRAQARVAGFVPWSPGADSAHYPGELPECSAATPIDAAVLIATSGSTGQPKIIPLTENQLLESARRVNDRLSVDTHSRWLLSLMPAHIGGLSIMVRAVVVGCAIVIPDNLKRTTLHRFARDYEVTHLSLVPSVAEEFISVGPLPPSVKVILFGGERITQPQRATLANVPACYLSYGATETASCIALAPLAEIAPLPDAVGTPVADTTIKIITETETDCAVGEIGIVHVTGPTVTTNTSMPIANTTYPTWRSTDRGFLDDNGILHVLGRADDVIVTGGIKVSAQEIIDAALATGLVTEAAVIKTPHPRWGEQPVLIVTTPDTTTTTLLYTALSTRLGKPRTPREIIILREMPRTAIGKVDRAQLREYALNNAKESSPIHHLVREHRGEG